MLKNHGWETPKRREFLPTTKPKSPLNDEEAKVLYSVDPGPRQGTKEHATLAHTIGYGYRNLLGELLCAHVLCWLDVAKFSIHPAAEHYQALKCLDIYLWRTIDWGIIYW